MKKSCGAVTILMCGDAARLLRLIAEAQQQSKIPQEDGSESVPPRRTHRASHSGESSVPSAMSMERT